MKAHRMFSDNVQQYLDDIEILDFVVQQEGLKEIYNEIKDKTLACVVPLVFVSDPVNFIVDLNIIVKHETPSEFGQYEYYLIPNFINKKTNLISLINSLTISTNADYKTILNSIGEQIKELHFQTSYDYKPYLKVDQEFIIFGLDIS
jgi:hypothetical protein